MKNLFSSILKIIVLFAILYELIQALFNNKPFVLWKAEQKKQWSKTPNKSLFIKFLLVLAILAIIALIAFQIHFLLNNKS